MTICLFHEYIAISPLAMPEGKPEDEIQASEVARKERRGGCCQGQARKPSTKQKEKGKFNGTRNCQGTQATCEYHIYTAQGFYS